MTRCYSLLIGVVLGAAAVGVATWLDFPVAKGARSTPSFPDEFLRAADKLDDMSPASSRKAELLRQAAAEQLSGSATDAGMYWAEIKRSAASSTATDALEKDHDTAALRKLIDFQDQLEDALIHAESVPDFEHAWQTWEQVDQTIRSNREELLKELADSFPRVLDSDNDGGLAAIQRRCRRLGDYLKDHQPQVVALLAAVRPTEALPAPVQAIVENAVQLETLCTAALAQAKKDLTEFRGRLRDPSIRTDPQKPEGSQPAEGRCTQLLRQIGELSAAKEHADIDTWVGLSHDHRSMKEATSDAESDGTDAVIMDLEQLASSTRQLAYNLWALREIHAAETVESWVGRLAQIDTGHLAPVVGALYSSACSKQLEQVQDPHQRSVVVQLLLSDPKIPLDAF